MAINKKEGDASAADLRPNGRDTEEERSGGWLGGHGIDPEETERHIKALASHGAGPCCDTAYAAVEHMRALQQLVTELEQTARDYDTLRENHTELQREYRELEAAVSWAMVNAELDGTCVRGLGALSYTDIEPHDGTVAGSVAALKRLHARSRT